MDYFIPLYSEPLELNILPVVTDECESAGDVMITHLCASEPLSSSHLVPRDDDRTFKVMQIKCVWRLICTQLGRLTIKREPLLGVTASAARHSLHLTPPQQRDSVHFPRQRLYSLSARCMCAVLFGAETQAV